MFAVLVMIHMRKMQMTSHKITKNIQLLNKNKSTISLNERKKNLTKDRRESAVCVCGNLRNDVKLRKIKNKIAGKSGKVVIGVVKIDKSS